MHNFAQIHDIAIKNEKLDTIHEIVFKCRHMDDQAKARESKPNAGRWVKGQSGNPGGRAKSSFEARLACRALNDQTLAVLVALLADKDGDLRFKAACRIRDEANGKPVQSVQIEQQEAEDYAAKSDEELIAIVQGAVLEHAARNQEQRS